MRLLNNRQDKHIINQAVCRRKLKNVMGTILTVFIYKCICNKIKLTVTSVLKNRSADWSFLSYAGFSTFVNCCVHVYFTSTFTPTSFMANH